MSTGVGKSLLMSDESLWNAAAIARVKAAMAGMTQDELARGAGIPIATLQRILSGTEPKAGNLIRLAHALDMSTDQLLGLAEMPAGERIEIPALTNLQASAGDGSLAETEQLGVGPFSFDQEWLRAQFGRINALRLIQIAGDSQEPDLHDGDWLIVDEAKNGIQNGLFVIVLDDCLMLKRLQMEGRFVQLLSRNPIYSGIAIDLSKEEDRLRIVGRAVYSFRSMA